MIRTPTSLPVQASATGSHATDRAMLGAKIVDLFVRDRLADDAPCGDKFAEEIMGWMLARADQMEIEEWTYGAKCLLEHLRKARPDACPDADEQVCVAADGRTTGQFPALDKRPPTSILELDRLVRTSMP